MIKWLLMTSLTGSVASSLFILLRTKLASKYGGRRYYYASLMALSLFILPLHFNVSINQPLFSLYEKQVQPDSTSAVIEMTAAIGSSMPDQTASASTTSENQDFSILSVDQWILGIWMVGCLAMLYRYFFAYFRFKKQAIQSSPIDRIGDLKVVVSDYVHSPMLIGFFKPTIVMPNANINAEDYQLALQHEWIHYKQRDAWIKLMAVLVNCLHWFNPVSYLALANISEACEYAVDEQITKGLKTTEKKRYSEMILHFASSSPVLNSNLAQPKKQLCRRFSLIMKRNTGSGKTVLGIFLVVLITTVSVFSSSVVFAEKSKPLTEDRADIKTYYDTFKTPEENVEIALGTKSMHTSTNLYIDADGRKIDDFNHTEPYYKIHQYWQDKESAANMINKTMSIEGHTVTVAFSERAKDYIDDKVIKQMIVNQITFDLDYQDPKYKYDHQAFIKELMKRGVYVIEEVITPKQFTYSLSQKTSGAIAGHKMYTSYDKKTKIADIFNGKVKLPKTNLNDIGEINQAEETLAKQGVQLGAAFVIKNGETLAISIKELSDKMPKIHLAIIDETTGKIVDSIFNASFTWSRHIYTPGKNEVNHSFKVVASGDEQDHAKLEIYTYKTGKEEVNIANKEEVKVNITN
ncbi:M56 family metallopeptidase [Paenibacillus sp. N3/727]|uniref:M56 family metallopeptidase n=1 Tax=Paenibacillus sp. N3/727 TaxID=2925845 RepID=UPI001F533A6C|nr:M56 family metallopeptidase [Paenibacillus sp. N3/727]UNK18703.1 M56 family metallopeptidase [Paenibacillus sp. N3/727]